MPSTAPNVLASVLFSPPNLARLTRNTNKKAIPESRRQKINIPGLIVIKTSYLLHIFLQMLFLNFVNIAGEDYGNDFFLAVEIKADAVFAIGYIAIGLYFIFL